MKWVLKRLQHDGLGAGLAALLLFLATIAIRWPGVAMYDSVSQYGQALAGDYADWHPPIMARTWALLLTLWPGTLPFFLIQCALWWGGIGLIAVGLARRGRGRAAACIAAAGAAPLFVGWTTVVLKDAQMAACLAASVGLAAHFRLDGRRVPWAAAGVIAGLIGYATLARGNALFATVPLVLALIDWGGLRTWWSRLALTLVAMGAVIALSPLINHRLLGAEASKVERALPLYDLAGIAHFGKLATMPGLPRDRWAVAERRGCYTPFFWNPYGEEDQCAFVGESLAFGDGAGGRLMRDWIVTVARHPLAYAAHRIVHLNTNLRFWVGPGEPDAQPPVSSEPNDLGLGGPASRAGHLLVAAAAWQAASPLGWPCVALAVALALLWAARGDVAPAPGRAQVRLGRTLALSAAWMSGSFALVSIASDLRYHLWSMVAAALASVLLIDARAIDARRGRIAALGVGVVILIAGVGHLGLAAPVSVPLPAYVAPPLPHA